MRQFNKSLILLSLLLLSIGRGGAAEQESLNTLAPKAPENLLMDILQLENNRLLTVGERGHVLISDDNGESWQQIRVPTSALLTRLFFIDDKVGWAVGHQQTILKTEDAGSTWELQHKNNSLDQPALFGVWFRNKNEGIAVGSYGLYLKTSDGGETWEEVYQEALEDMEIGFVHFYAIAFERKSQKLYMAGEMGFIAISEDYGQTWQKMESPYSGSFFDMEALPNGYLVVVGLRGHMFRSTDLGQSWDSIDTGTISGLQRIILLPNRKLLIVGTNGTQLVSDDYGKSVKLFQRSDRVHLAGAVALPNTDILVVGVDGVMRAEFNNK